MPLIESYHDSLPYIDKPPTDASRARINALINSALPPSAHTTLHPSLPPLLKSNLSPVMMIELERVAVKQSLNAIDISRYAPPDTPSDSASSEDWKEALRQAYTTSSHVETRAKNLALLEQFGKNAWLVGNSQVEQELRTVEQDLADSEKSLENLNMERKTGQETVQGELEGLEEAWKKGVGRAIEVELANERLRVEILELRRQTS